MPLHQNHNPSKVVSEELKKDVFIKNLKVEELQNLSLQNTDSQQICKSKLKSQLTESVLRIEECEEIKEKMNNLLEG